MVTQVSDSGPRGPPVCGMGDNVLVCKYDSKLIPRSLLRNALTRYAHIYIL